MTPWEIVDLVNGQNMVIADRRDEERRLLSRVGPKPSLAAYALSLHELSYDRQLTLTQRQLCSHAAAQLRRHYTTADEMEESLTPPRIRGRRRRALAR